MYLCVYIVQKQKTCCFLFRFTKAQFEICRIDIVMNLCIYIFIYLYSYESMYLCVYSVQKQNTCCFSFSNMYSFD